MVKYCLFFLLVIFLSCNCYKGNHNEYGFKRDDFKFKENQIFTYSYLNFFDTSIVYKKTGYFYGKNYFEFDKNTYLRFYSSNKVSKFYNINHICDETFDPEKSSMGYCYQDVNGKWFLQFWVNGECNYLVKRYLYLKKTNDQIHLYDVLNSKKDSIIDVYVPVNVESSFLSKSKPDW